MTRILLFNKPYGVLCQFTGREGRPTLSQYIRIPEFYAAGRLDTDSEGLLVLTDDGRLQQRISDPRFKLPKTYFVQTEGEPSGPTLASLRRGVILKDGPARPLRVRRIDEPSLWPRVPPIRHRKNVLVSWLEITVTEGRNRLVRRMTAAVGHPTLRLIRISIGPWELGDLMPGQWRWERLHDPLY